MDVLLSPALIDTYIKTRSKFRKTDAEKLIADTVESEENTLIINKLLLDYYESQFDDQTSERDFFRDEFAAVINERSFSVKAEASNQLQLLKNLETNYLSSSRRKTYVNLGCTLTDITLSRFSASIQNLNNFKDELFFKLAASGQNGITFWQHDFRNNQQISDLFEILYDLRRNASPVNHFNAFVSVNHRYHDKLISEGARFTYYTKNAGTTERILDDDIIQEKYVRVTVLRGKRNQIHERRLMFLDLLIEANNDWENLLIEETTWKIDVIVSSSICDSILHAKKPHFR